MVVCVLVCAFLAAHAKATGELKTPPFHAQKSVAGEKLNSILNTLSKEETFTAEVLGRAPSTPNAKTLTAKCVTNALVVSWKNAEKTSVDKNCGGQYRAGEICGLDYDPLFCAQDFPEFPITYDTEYLDEETALISAKAGKPLANFATYRMILEDGAWKIDGVQCAAGGSFHMTAQKIPQKTNH